MDPATTSVAASLALLIMLSAGMFKRQLTWKRRPPRRRRRLPRFRELAPQGISSSTPSSTTSVARSSNGSSASSASTSAPAAIVPMLASA